MQSQEQSAPAAEVLVDGWRHWFVRKKAGVQHRLKLVPDLRRFGSNRVVTFAAAKEEVQSSKLMRVIGSCHTIEQLEACRTWLSSLISNDTLQSFEALQLVGAIDMSEGWLQRRFEPMQKAWKWQHKN